VRKIADEEKTSDTIEKSRIQTFGLKKWRKKTCQRRQALEIGGPTQAKDETQKGKNRERGGKKGKKWLGKYRTSSENDRRPSKCQMEVGEKRLL